MIKDSSRYSTPREEERVREREGVERVIMRQREIMREKSRARE